MFPAYAGMIRKVNHVRPWPRVPRLRDDPGGHQPVFPAYAGMIRPAALLHAKRVFRVFPAYAGMIRRIQPSHHSSEGNVFPAYAGMIRSFPSILENEVMSVPRLRGDDPADRGPAIG